MYTYTEGHCRLISIGAYIPEQIITSAELMREIDSENRFGISHEWFERVTGIKERRFADEKLKPSDMATIAATEALEKANLLADDIDVIIYCGLFRDYLIEPATAHVVQTKLGSKHALAFDVTNACHGFMNAIHLMDALIATGQAKFGLIVTGEKPSSVVRMALDKIKQINDKEQFLPVSSGLGLGDAGGAIVVGKKDDPRTGFMGFMLRSESDLYALSTCGNELEATRLQANLSALISHGIRLSSEIYPIFMSKIGWKPEDLFACGQHQASTKMLKEFSKYSRIPLTNIVNTVTRYGNLVSANIPINLYLINKDKSPSYGDKILLTGGGSGVVVSNAGLVWDKV